MPIYFLLSIWVLLSVGPEPTPQAYFERGALFYNALTLRARDFGGAAASLPAEQSSRQPLTVSRSSPAILLNHRAAKRSPNSLLRDESFPTTPARPMRRQ